MLQMNSQTNAGEKGALDTDKREYEAILSAIREGVCRIDSDRRVVYANESAARILGRPLNEIVGMSYPRLFFDADSSGDPRCAPIEFAISEGEVAHIEGEKVARPDGSEQVAEFVCVPVGERGKRGAVVSFTDVTNRREVEDAVSASRDNALKAARSKAEFLAHMSHEIRTPLTGIIGTTDLLSRTELSEDQAEYLRMLRSSSEFLFSIVNDILDFSKLEAGKFLPRNDPFSLREIAEKSLDSYRSSASEKDLTLSVEIADGLTDAVVGDSRCLRQILNNLLSNAVKFTDQGSVSIHISKGRTEDTVRFAVVDTGIGIEAGKRESLFAPFEQSAADGDRALEGTGLGLAISRRLVTLLRGEIGFETKTASGTEFWFEIPLKAAEQQQHSAPAPDRAVLQYGAFKPSVLVVEDNPVNLKVMQRMLAEIGLESDSAHDGESAVEACGSKRFDIVFMDCQLPGMNGIEATRRILELKNGSPLVIAFTANVSDSDSKKYSAAGMSGILRKPFTEKDLVKVMNSLDVTADGTKFLDLGKEFIEHSLSQFVEVETLNRLLSLESDDPRGFLTEILEVFVRHASAKLSELRNHFADGDREGVKRVAHNLRGSSANLGIRDLSDLFGELEEIATGGGWAELDTLIQKLTGEFERIKTAITRLKLKEDPNDGKRGTGYKRG